MGTRSPENMRERLPLAVLVHLERVARQPGHVPAVGIDDGGRNGDEIDT